MDTDKIAQSISINPKTDQHTPSSALKSDPPYGDDPPSGIEEKKRASNRKSDGGDAPTGKSNQRRTPTMRVALPIGKPLLEELNRHPGLRYIDQETRLTILKTAVQRLSVKRIRSIIDDLLAPEGAGDTADADE
jgi:hypothetical protein